MHTLSSIPHLPLCLLFLQHCSISLALNIIWTEPHAGDVYRSGSHIVGEWHSSDALPAPSFKLCRNEPDAGYASNDDDDNDCGTAVEPAVVPGVVDGSYQVTLTMPEVTEVSDFVLELFTEAGSSTSPPFSLSPSNTPDPLDPSSAAQPNGAALTPETTALEAAPHPAQMHVPVSPAAYAVPLSIAGAIIVFACILSAIQRRKLLKERAETREEFTRFQSMFHGSSGLLRRFTFRRFTLRRSPSDPFPPPMQRTPSIPEVIVEGKTLEPQDEGDCYTRVYVPHLDRRPRPITKEPFYTPTGRATDPPYYFASQPSPRIPYLSALTQDPPPSAFARCRESSVTSRNAAITGSVVDRYLQPSPYPGQRHVPACPAMQPAHLRKHVPSDPFPSGPDETSKDEIYEEVVRRLK